MPALSTGSALADYENPVPVAAGGTGASTAAGALGALGGEPLETAKMQRTIFVDATRGSDATGSRGKIGKPFLTITAALAAALRGDTIWVWPGRYNERPLGKGFVDAVSAAVRASNVVTFTAAAHGFAVGDRVRIVGTTGADGEHLITAVAAGSFNIYLPGAAGAIVCAAGTNALGVLNLHFCAGAHLAFVTDSVEGGLWDDSHDYGCDSPFWLVFSGAGSFSGINTTLAETAGGILFVMLFSKGSRVEGVILDARSATNKVVLAAGDSQVVHLTALGDLWAGYDLISANGATNVDIEIRASKVRARGGILESGHTGSVTVEFSQAVADTLLAAGDGAGLSIVRGRKAATGYIASGGSGASEAIIQVDNLTFSETAAISFSAAGTQSVTLLNTRAVASNASGKIADVVGTPVLTFRGCVLVCGASATNSFTGSGGAVDIKNVGSCTNKALHGNVTSDIQAMTVSADVV